MSRESRNVPRTPAHATTCRSGSSGADYLREYHDQVPAAVPLERLQLLADLALRELVVELGLDAHDRRVVPFGEGQDEVDVPDAFAPHRREIAKGPDAQVERLLAACLRNAGLTPAWVWTVLDSACARASGATARDVLSKICTKGAPRALLETRKPPRERGFSVAVPVGFEPTVELPPHMFSRHDPSAARTRYRERVYTIAGVLTTTAGRHPLHRRRRPARRPRVGLGRARDEQGRVRSPA